MWCSASHNKHIRTPFCSHFQPNSMTLFICWRLSYSFEARGTLQIWPSSRVLQAQRNIENITIIIYIFVLYNIYWYGISFRSKYVMCFQWQATLYCHAYINKCIDGENWDRALNCLLRKSERNNRRKGNSPDERRTTMNNGIMCVCVCVLYVDVCMS